MLISVKTEIKIDTDDPIGYVDCYYNVYHNYNDYYNHNDNHKVSTRSVLRRQVGILLQSIFGSS